jgi:7-carboxy-7-deazaguanine synthase
LLEVANLVEIFSSVQGEGIHVGASTVFVRFGKCDLRCRWCDSPVTWQPARLCRLEIARGTGRFRTLPNPVRLEDAVAAADALEVSSHRFASLTGGEPLLQPRAVGVLARALRARGPRILLETHGIATAGLEEVIESVDVVSMDWKLASDVRRAADPRHGAVASFDEAHAAFLRIARRAPEVVVKVVVSTRTDVAELDEVCRRIEKIDPRTPLVLQPVTPFGAVREAVEPERLLALAARAERLLADVRVIPQTHKQIGAL